MSTDTDAAVDAGGAAPASAPARSWPRRLLGALLVFVVACLATAPVSIYNIRTYRAVNYVDEGSYIDYLARVDTGHLVVGEGTNTGSVLDHAVQCRGLGHTFVGFAGYAVPPNPAACNGAPHTAFVTRDAADIDPPTYYLVTDVGVKVIRGLGLTHDIVQAGRLVGIFWGGLGLSLLFLLARLLGARRLPATIICAVALVTSGIYEYWSYITPHGADFPLGAAAAIVALLWRRRQLPTWTLFLAGAVPVLFEASDVLISVALGLYFVVLGWLRLHDRESDAADTRGEIGRLVVGLVTLGAGIVVASVGWLVVRKHYALTHTPAYESLFHVGSFQLHFILDQVGGFAQPYQPDVGLVVAFWTLGSVVLYASRRIDADVDRQALAVALVPVIAFGACIFSISDYLTLHEYYKILPRYGLTILPLILAFGAVNLRTRWAQLGGALTVVVLCYLVAHPVG